MERTNPTTRRRIFHENRFEFDCESGQPRTATRSSTGAHSIHIHPVVDIVSEMIQIFVVASPKYANGYGHFIPTRIWLLVSSTHFINTFI